MKTFVQACVVLCVLALPAPREFCTEPFEIATVQVSPVGQDAPVDFEFDGRDVSDPQIMYARERIFVSGLDPQTGEMVGTPQLVATSLARTWGVLGIPTLGNGPEWGYSTRGSELYFMRAYGTNSRQLWKAVRTVSGAWSAVALPGGTGRAMPWPSKDPGDPCPRLIYAVYPRTGVQSQVPYDVAVRDVPEDPSTEQVIPVPVIGKVGGPRWIQGHRQVVFTLLDPQGREQVAIYDMDTRSVSSVTNEDGLNVDEAWASVYADGSVAIWFVDHGTLLRVFTQDSEGTWSEANRCAWGTAEKPYILSPEPFFYAGRAYIVFQIAASPGIEDQPSDIWITEPQATLACHFRRVSPENNVFRRKPEALELSDRLVVYYLELNGGIHAIYRTETGL